jgi:DNA-binding sugar fermentation-stimulating protein
MYPATVVCRPSATNKSPYVCDVVLDSGEKGMCHSPGLGCSGLVAAKRRIWVTRNASATNKTAFTTQIAECTDAEGSYTVGIHPMASQKAAAGLLDRLGFGPTVKWATEVKVDDHTRLDFVGTTVDNKKIYVEVKNAMISHQEGVPRALRRAIFPEGFRKKKDDPVSSSRKARGTKRAACATPLSPRAVKHAEVLAALAQKPTTLAAILLFVLPRTDCGGGLEINPTDRVYSAAIATALRTGVQARVFSLGFDHTAVVTFDRELPLFVPGAHVRRRLRLGPPLNIGPERREDAEAGALTRN